MSRSHTRPTILLSLAMAFGLALSTTAPASAHDYRLGSLEISQPWTRATPATAQTGGGADRRRLPHHHQQRHDPRPPDRRAQSGVEQGRGP